MRKAVLLLSGGLDSTLAGKILLDLGVMVEAVNFTSPFCNCTAKGAGCSAARRAAEQLGVSVKVFACGREYLQVMKHPRFGRGRGMNACIDCRIYMFSRAREYMEKRGFDFVATGEVLGERPMSQSKAAMALIERESGLVGRIVRPLSAQHFPPSIPEQQGLIERSRLEGIQGRCRKPQLEMAQELGLADLPCPAGGCKLAQKEFAIKFSELLANEPGFGLHDAMLLRYGRHFRLPSGAKAVVGRREGENRILEGAAGMNDAVLVPKKVPGPSVLVRRYTSADDLRLAASILAAYTKNASTLEVIVRNGGVIGVDGWVETVVPMDRDVLETLKIGGDPSRRAPL